MCITKVGELGIPSESAVLRPARPEPDVLPVRGRDEWRDRLVERVRCGARPRGDRGRRLSATSLSACDTAAGVEATTTVAVGSSTDTGGSGERLASLSGDAVDRRRARAGLVLGAGVDRPRRLLRLACFRRWRRAARFRAFSSSTRRRA